MKQKITFYKIKDVSTGLYSCGGVEPVFNKRGKVWNNIAHIKAHLTGIKQHQDHQQSLSKPQFAWQLPAKKPKTYNMRNWQVEEYIFEQTEQNIVPIEELIIASGLF